MRKGHLILGLIILCAAVRLLFVFSTPYETYVVNDMAFIHTQALDTLHHNLGSIALMWPPFYYLVLAAFYAVIGAVGLLGANVPLTLLLQVALGSVGVFFIFRITEKLSSTRVAVAAGIIYAFFYPIVHLNAFILSENIFIPLVLCILYIIICRLDSGSYGTWVLLGILFAAATLARPIFAAFVPLFLLWYWYTYHGRKTFRIAFLCLFLCAAACIVAFQAGFNTAVMHEVTVSPSSLGGADFAMHWCELRQVEFHNGGTWWKFWSTTRASGPMLSTDVEFWHQAFYYNKGLSCIRQDPGVLFRNFLELRFLFHSAIFPRFDSLPNTSLFFLIADVLTYALLVPLSVLAYFWLTPANRKYWWLFAILLLSLVIMVYLQAPPERRYLTPYETVVIILGPIGFAGAFRWIARKRKART